jgi:hypothetical protein
MQQRESMLYYLRRAYQAAVSRFISEQVARMADKISDCAQCDLVQMQEEAAQVH